MSFLGNRTQRVHPLYVPIANKWSYWTYTARRNIKWISMIALVLLVYSLVGAVLDIMDLVSGSVWNRVLYIAAFALSAIIKVLDLAAHYEDRFTTEERDEGFYENVEAPGKEWERLDLRMGGKGTEPVFRSDKVDELLRSDRPLDIVRDRDYEKRLNNHISRKENWENTYRKFLRHNHREAMYSGKQFYNEIKYGLCSEPDPAHPEKPVRIHKTCYFDSYLTNIIPGRVLTRNRDKEEMARATDPKWIPYTLDESGSRRLRATGECAMANEPGVTTLCIKENGSILLWRQNNLAQCSTGQLVASGSGSANWGDCRDFLNDPEKNGLRKAVIRGMERELWEESVGQRGISDRKFYENLDTRITGYFRWLKKGGKAEFVGVSRLRNSNSMTENMVPEVSEVLAGEDIPVRSMWMLTEKLQKHLEKPLGEKPYEGVDGENTYSVSCTMAMYALRNVCREYCAQTCPWAKRDGCRGEDCPCKPFDVLFEKETR